VKARQPEARVLIMTGYSRDAVNDQWPVDAGIEMLNKPLTQDDLERKLRLVMGGQNT
jgi:ActR/RegA family two-component response regulator